MSKQIKNMIIRDYQVRMEGFQDAALVSLRGVNGADTTRLRSALRAKNIRITMIRNQLARQSFKGTGLLALEPLLEGSSVVVYGGQSVVEVSRELIAALATIPTVEVKGAVLDGQLFKGKKGVEELSRFPTRIEAQGLAVGILLGPAKKLLAQVKGPGGKLAGIIKAIEEKLEKGEAIAKLAG
jgi:large subunit ribosomal protein L10